MTTGEDPTNGTADEAVPRRPGMAERAFADLSGPTRRGQTFATTPADFAAFARDYRTHLRRRRDAGRGRLGRIVDLWIGLAMVAFGLAFAIVAIGLARGFYVEAGSNVVAGTILGSGLAVVALLALSFATVRQRAHDPNWTFTTIRIGVEAGTLWIFKRGTLSIFTSPGAFVDVTRTDRSVLAFINKTTAHCFPLKTLAASAEGRDVLDWFDAHWPQQPSRRPTGWEWRRELRLAARRCRNTALALGVLGLLYACIQFLTNRPHDVPEAGPPFSGPASIVAPARAPDPSLEGGNATDFLHRLAHPLGR